MEAEIKKLAILNAFEHGGKADVNSVLGKLVSSDPSVKKDIKSLIPKIRDAVDRVNSMSQSELEAAVSKMGVEKKEKREETNELPELPDAKKGKVVTAFPPEPSKYPHLGHAKSALVNHTYAKRYGGKFILRFEDSNPDVAKKECYDAIMDGLKWLGLEWDQLDYLSDHMDEYYAVIERLIRSGDGYICTCPAEETKNRRASGEGCACRDLDQKENMERWQKMLKDAAPGSMVFRMRIDMKAENTTMRDPTLARIIEEPHVRTKKKYRVWPNYDLGTSMLDAWGKVTHRVRTKEFELRKELQDHISSKLKMKPPFIMEIGRFQIKDAITQGRDIREGINTRLYSGWDDPRLATLVALRRRGFSPDALKEFLLSTGVTKAESVYDWQVIESFNRKAIDPVSDRYFAVLDPVKIRVDGLPKKDVEVSLRPGSKERRKIAIDSDNVFIDKEDDLSLRGQKAGLMFLCTVSMGEVKRFVSVDVPQEVPKIHWVGEPNVQVTVRMPDGRTLEGIGEAGMRKLKVGQTIQLYRVGFCRVDEVGKKVALYFAHK